MLFHTDFNRTVENFYRAFIIVRRFRDGVARKVLGFCFRFRVIYLPLS